LAIFRSKPPLHDDFLFDVIGFRVRRRLDRIGGGRRLFWLQRQAADHRLWPHYPCAAHHQPLRTWILCLYFMGLNLSNQQIAQELGLHKGDVQQMASQLRQGILDHKEPVTLQDEVECDEVYNVAGHKGHPTEVEKKDDRDDATASKDDADEEH
jgi:hypothetical protein